MRTAVVVGVLAATEASAQPINLTGRYRCVIRCQPGLTGYPAFITQNGWSVNLLNEAGESSRGWIEGGSYGRLWAAAWNQGAVYTPDGVTVQFDSGTIWQRDLGRRIVKRRVRR